MFPPCLLPSCAATRCIMQQLSAPLHALPLLACHICFVACPRANSPFPSPLALLLLLLLRGAVPGVHRGPGAPLPLGA
jgi:hypothetical protein